MRFIASALWVFVTLAFAFDAVAEPCDLRLKFETEQTATSEMPCHDDMGMGIVVSSESDSPHAPEHHEDTCCCAALLTNAVAIGRMEMQQPIPGLSVWASPLPETARSVTFEYEPPPPRA